MAPTAPAENGRGLAVGDGRGLKAGWAWLEGFVRVRDGGGSWGWWSLKVAASPLSVGFGVVRVQLVEGLQLK